jgi:hypothetical protein
VHSSTRAILIGLALDVLAGVFVGEKAEVSQFRRQGLSRASADDGAGIRHGFIDRGIGRLDGARARLLFTRVGTVSLVLWVLVLGAGCDCWAPAATTRTI